MPSRTLAGEVALTIAEKVLVTDGGNGQGRSALAAVRALRAGGYAPDVTRSGPHSLAAASRDRVAVVDVPAVGDDGYAPAVAAAVERGGYAAVVAASDAALITLELPGAALVDKERVAARAAACGVATVASQRFADAAALHAAATTLDYPVVVKPTVSRFPAVFARDAAQLPAGEAITGPLLVQPFLTDPLRAVAGVVWDGALVAVVHQRYLRTWPVPCGTACAAETVGPDRELEERLPALLTGYDGVFQLQLAGDRLLDCNPRVYGSLPLAVAAGANLPAIACDLARGEAVEPVRGRPGVAYRWLEGDLRHLWRGLCRRELRPADAMRALSPRRGSAHSVESLRDPGPLLARIRYALRPSPGRDGSG